ncbi:HAD-like domain-containing protein [Catenaria anguillulae PL171]|uniref:HAD-like domain-containing protein n=1 Tax=Catenaria anguillulae PL171 TaxID=765915 RepID=A0A1Y2HKR6_9FUNG|nr:HAD-like domain-containing protein [Catenaria anguillulae PL171]
MPLSPLNNSSALQRDFEASTSVVSAPSPAEYNAAARANTAANALGSAAKSIIEKNPIKGISGLRAVAWSQAASFAKSLVGPATTAPALTRPFTGNTSITLGTTRALDLVDHDLVMTDVANSTEFPEDLYRVANIDAARADDVFNSVAPPASKVFHTDSTEVANDLATALKAERSLSLPRTPAPVPQITSWPIPCPPGSKPILALDLDETLIHSSQTPSRILRAGAVRPSFHIDVIQNNDPRTHETFWVYERPWAREFLATVAEHYTVLVFTAGIREYASQILDRLDPHCQFIQGRLYRDSCTDTSTFSSRAAIGTSFTKDMTKVAADLTRVLLVDNTKGCFHMQPTNGILIRSWYSDEKDCELQRLAEFLLTAKDESNMQQAATKWISGC